MRKVLAGRYSGLPTIGSLSAARSKRLDRVCRLRVSAFHAAAPRQG